MQENQSKSCSIKGFQENPKMPDRHAFTLTEVLLVLGIIGILAMTMLSLNSSKTMNYNTASLKLAQADSALRTWSKAQTASTETGLSIFETVQDQSALTNMLTSAFNMANNTVVESSPALMGSTLAMEEFDIENGVTVGSSYLKSSCDAGGAGEPCAYIKLSIPATKNGSKIVLSEEYGVYSDGVTSAEDIFKGYTPYPVQSGCKDKDNCKDGEIYCNGAAYCYEPCDKNGENCSKLPVDGSLNPENSENVYVKALEAACPDSNTNGVVVTTIAKTLTSTDGVEEVYDTCCTNPKTFSGFDKDGAKICVCPAATGFVASEGYGYDATAETCQSICTKGSYSDGSACVLCEVGHYCPEDGATESTECPKGYYCPNNHKDKDKYHKDKYTYDDDGKLTETKDGGLKDKIICPAGYYCPDGSEKPKDCPVGAYCPEGSGEPTLCPAGTFNDASNAKDASACKPCPENTYSASAGSEECKPCNGGFTNGTGATYCQNCPIGSEYKAGKCTACAKGQYFDVNTQKCLPCAAGTYQNKEGQLECKSCTAGSYSPELAKNATIGATACTPCAAGTVQPLEGQSSCNACEKGSYQSKEGQLECILCPINTYSDTTGTAECTSCMDGATTDAEGSTSKDECKCSAGYYHKTEATWHTVSSAEKRTDEVTGKVSYCWYERSHTSTYPPYYTVTEKCVEANDSNVGYNYCYISTKQSQPHTAGIATAIYADYEWQAIELCTVELLYPDEYTKCMQAPCGKYATDGILYECPAGTFQPQYRQSSESSCKSPNSGYYVSYDKCYQYKPAPPPPPEPEPEPEPTKTCPDYGTLSVYKNNANNNTTGRNRTVGELADFANDKDEIDSEVKDTVIGVGNIVIVDEAGNNIYHGSGEDISGLDTIKSINNKKNNKKLGSGAITIDGCPYDVDGGYVRNYSPLVLDLKGDGLEFTSLLDGVIFDLDADGNTQPVAWTKVQTEFDNAFLCLDKNNNGQIDDGKELFGDQSGEKTGFGELAKYDDNKDGKITKEDTVYAKLLLWVDMDKNGKVDYKEDGSTDELKTLEEMMVTELSTDYKTEYDENGNVKTDEHGNITGFVGHFKHLVEQIVDGIKTLVEKIGTMIDVFFLSL